MKLPPHSLDAERAVLGGVLLDNAVLLDVRDVLDPGDFYSPDHRASFRCMISLEDAGRQIDLITVTDRLRSEGADPELIESIYKLTDEVPTAAGVLGYAEIIKSKATQRRYMDVGRNIHQIAQKIESPGLLQAEVEAKVFLAADRKSFGASPIYDGLEKVEEELSATYETGRPLGLSMGFRRLDAKTGGLQSSSLTIVAARPSVGKTALVLQTLYAAAVAGKPCLLFSLEMDRESLLRRLGCYEAKVSYQRLVSGDLDPEDLSRFFAALRGIKNRELPLYIDDSPGLSAEDFLTRGRRYALRHRLHLIALDYLQLSAAATKGDSLVERTGKVSAAGKALAKKTGCPVVLLSQLNREVEKQSQDGDPGIPGLHNLRDSGALEQDADIVLFLWRGSLYSERYRPEDGRIIIGKNRNGPTGYVDARWTPRVGCWMD